jgi:two-component system, NtrC family, sensor kinase
MVMAIEMEPELSVELGSVDLGSDDSKILVLVVDDEPEVERLFRQRFRKQLRRADFDFVFADNGNEALRILRESPSQICLVLTDINMPEMDGLTLLSKLPEIDQNLKAVVVSAYGDIKNIRSAMNRGAFDFVTKPIDFADLEITINKTLNFVKYVRSQQAQLQQTQTQLLQSEKMASLGQLMSGVAHEIKNPVNFIYNNVSPAKEYVETLTSFIKYYQQNADPDDLDFNIPANFDAAELDFVLADLGKILNGIELGTEMLLNISATLRNFARSDDANPVTASLHTCLDTVLIILSHRFKARGKFPEIIVNKQYGELIMNILANGIEALEEAVEKGMMIGRSPKITIRTEAIDSDWVTVSIADNGVGMTEEVRQMIFEPLFTTKPSGKGTGLGMAISRQIIVERHHGRLSCLSVSGEGTEFLIQIPRK